MNTPGLGTTTTSNSELYMSQLEADKRSILESVLRLDLMGSARNVVRSQPIHINRDNAEGSDAQQKSPPRPVINIDKEYADIFGPDNSDDDDSEELFAAVVKRVEEEVERQKAMRNKNPYHTMVANEFLFKAPRAKRERAKQPPKNIRTAMNLMDNFRKNLAEAEELEKSDRLFVPTPTGLDLGIQSSSADSRPRKTKSKSSSSTSMPKSSTVVQAQAPAREVRYEPMNTVNQTPKLMTYPNWKTTATYTPIFEAPSNPRWEGTNVLHSAKRTPKSPKMYTPGHIAGWVEDTAANAQKPPSSRSIKSSNVSCRTDVTRNSDTTPTAAISNLIRDENNVPISPILPIGQSTPINATKNRSSTDTSERRKSVVRFKEASPELIPWSADNFSDLSSASSLILENRRDDVFQPSPLQRQVREDREEEEEEEEAASSISQVSPPIIQGLPRPDLQVSPLSRRGEIVETYQQQQQYQQQYQQQGDGAEDTMSIDSCDQLISMMQNVEGNDDSRMEGASNIARYGDNNNSASYDEVARQQQQQHQQEEQQPFQFDDFVRKLQNNMQNNRSVSVKYSMKVKYFD